MKVARNMLGCGLVLALVGCASNPEPGSGPTDSGSPATERAPAARGPSLDQAREAPFAVQHRGSRPQRQERPRVVRIDNSVEVASAEPEAPRPEAAEEAPASAAPAAAPRAAAEPLLGEVNARPPAGSRPPANRTTDTRTTETRTATPARQPAQPTPTRPTPAPQPRAPSSTPAGTRSHVVAQGETLFSLARRYGVSVEAIRTANKLPDTNIRIGQKLIIPAS